MRETLPLRRYRFSLTKHGQWVAFLLLGFGTANSWGVGDRPDIDVDFCFENRQKVIDAIDSGPHTVTAAKKLGLIDRIAYDDEIEAMIQQRIQVVSALYKIIP